MHRLKPLIWPCIAAVLASLVLAGADAPPGLPSIDLSKFFDLLLGPVGLTVGSLFVVWQFTSDKWLTAKRSDAQAAKVEAIWRERWQEMKDDRDTAIDISEKAVAGYTSVAEAIRERNRLDTLRVRSMQTGDADPEDLNDLPEPDPKPVRPAQTARPRGPKR